MRTGRLHVYGRLVAGGVETLPGAFLQLVRYAVRAIMAV